MNYYYVELIGKGFVGFGKELEFFPSWQYASLFKSIKSSEDLIKYFSDFFEEDEEFFLHSVRFDSGHQAILI